MLPNATFPPPQTDQLQYLAKIITATTSQDAGIRGGDYGKPYTERVRLRLLADQFYRPATPSITPTLGYFSCGFVTDHEAS